MSPTPPKDPLMVGRPRFLVKAFITSDDSPLQVKSSTN